MGYITQKKNTSAGSILLLVLWALVFLSLLTVASGTIARQQILLSDNIEKRVELYSLLSSGAMIMLDVVGAAEGKDIFNEKDMVEILTEKEPAFSGIVRLGNGVFSWGEGEEAVPEEEENTRRFGLVDETGKINVNFADINILTKILTIAGALDASKAGVLAGNIIDWRDQNDTVLAGESIAGESAGYSRSEHKYEPRNRPFVSLEELLLVLGMEPEVFVKVRDHLTVYGDGKININTASAEVLEAMGISKVLSGRIINFRKGDTSRGENPENRVFRVPGDLRGVLEEKGEGQIREEDMVEVDNLLLSGIVGTEAEVFSFLCTGKLDRGGPEGRLLCAFDRTGKLLYWGYFMVRGEE